MFPQKHGSLQMKTGTIISWFLGVIGVFIVCQFVVFFHQTNSHQNNIFITEILQETPPPLPPTADDGFYAAFDPSTWLPRMEKQHCVITDVVVPEFEDRSRITLVLHGSVGHIKDIDKHVTNWNGPISLAIVFRPKNDFESDTLHCVINYLSNLTSSNSLALQYLSVHLIFEDFPAKKCDKNELSAALNSSSTNSKPCKFQKLPEKRVPMSRRQILKTVKYPINFARNLARKRAKTNFILSADFDHFFSSHFEQKMRALAATTLIQNPKQVLVYRIFEIRATVDFPKNKKNLRNMLRKRSAIQFHETFTHAHKIPYLEEWLQYPDQGDFNTSVQFVQKYDTFEWEPQFVARRDIPLHDESFKYPARDNTELRWELCRAAYTFPVVHDVFMFHPGIKSTTQNERISGARTYLFSQTELNVHKFNIRMNETYPETANSCPEFHP